MSVGRGLAKVLMHCAAFLAPRDRAEWMQAMRAEFEATGDAQSLSWAAGCVGTSLLWRARAEAIYVAALVVAVMAYVPFIIFMIENVIGEKAPAEYLFPATHAAERGYLALATFLLCVYRPSRMLLTAILTPLCVHTLPVAISIWRDPLPPGSDIAERLWWTVDVIQIESWLFGGAAALAALLAFGLNRLMRSRRRARS